VSEEKCRHPAPGHNRYLRVRVPTKKNLPKLPTRVYKPTLPPLKNKQKQLMAIVVGLTIN